jgi:predicted nucleic acid-binding protein
LTTNPKASLGAVDFTQAIAVLDQLTKKPGYCFWAITESWPALTAPFADRIFGHQQVTDAYLLGLAIKEDGVLVTFDRGLKYMAGAEFSRNLLVLE